MTLSDYATPIVEAYQKRSGGLTVSSADFELVRRWRDRGIPLRVVLTALEETKTPKRLGSLYYYANAVEDEFRRWAKALGYVVSA